MTKVWATKHMLSQGNNQPNKTHRHQLATTSKHTVMQVQNSTKLKNQTNKHKGPSQPPPATVERPATVENTTITKTITKNMLRAITNQTKHTGASHSYHQQNTTINYGTKQNTITNNNNNQPNKTLPAGNNQPNKTNNWLPNTSVPISVMSLFWTWVLQKDDI